MDGLLGGPVVDREASQPQGRETEPPHSGAAVAENPVLEHVLDCWSAVCQLVSLGQPCQQMSDG
jgi:hypothetical protein